MASVKALPLTLPSCPYKAPRMAQDTFWDRGREPPPPLEAERRPSRQRGGFPEEERRKRCLGPKALSEQPFVAKQIIMKHEQSVPVPTGWLATGL